MDATISSTSAIGVASPLRVGVVDPYPAVALGVCAAVSGDAGMHAAARAATVRELIQQPSDLDVVILGVSLGEENRVHRDVRAMRTRGFEVLLYAWSADAIGGAEMLNDIVGVSLKSEPLEVMIAQRRRAAAIVRESATVRAPRVPAAACVPSLTEREIEVLRLYVSGRTARSVAQSLYISHHTVIGHIRNIRSKYAAAHRGVSSKTELYLRAREDGVIVT